MLEDRVDVSRRYIHNPEQNFMLGMILEAESAVLGLLRKFEDKHLFITVDDLQHQGKYPSVSEACACYAWLMNWHGCLGSEEEGYADVDAMNGLWIEDWIGDLPSMSADACRDHFTKRFEEYEFEVEGQQFLPHEDALGWIRKMSMNYAR